MRELLVSTLRTIRAHALRFALTSLGISWGTWMLVYMIAVSVGFDRHFQREVEEVGPRIVWLFPGVVVKDRVGERRGGAVELETRTPSASRGSRKSSTARRTPRSSRRSCAAAARRS